MIDENALNVGVSRFQFQPELFLKCREEGTLGRMITCYLTRFLAPVRECNFRRRRPVHRDVVLALEPGFNGDVSTDLH